MSASQAQEILATPQMDIPARISPASFDLSAENISFAYEQRKIIDGISLISPEDYHRYRRTLGRRKDHADLASFTLLGR